MILLKFSKILLPALVFWGNPRQDSAAQQQEYTNRWTCMPPHARGHVTPDRRTKEQAESPSLKQSERPKPVETARGLPSAQRQQKRPCLRGYP